MPTKRTMCLAAVCVSLCLGSPPAAIALSSANSGLLASTVAFALADGERDEVRRKKKPRKVTICHMPRHKPSVKRTIRVARRSVLRAHLRHGDTLGPCKGSPSKPD